MKDCAPAFCHVLSKSLFFLVLEVLIAAHCSSIRGLFMAWDWWKGGKGQQSSLAQGDALLSAEKMLHAHSLSAGCFPQAAHSWLFRHGEKLQSVSSVCTSLYIISAARVLTHIVLPGVDFQKVPSSPQSTKKPPRTSETQHLFVPFQGPVRFFSCLLSLFLPHNEPTSPPQKNPIPLPKASKSKNTQPPKKSHLSTQKVSDYQEGIS